MRLWFVVLAFQYSRRLVQCNARAQTSSLPTYALAEIIGIAVERNPLVAGALATIDQSTGQRTAAGAYPNPTVHGDGGKGYLRDAGPLTNEIPRSANEYMAGFSQPIEWPAKRAARQRAAEAGLAGASVGLVETRLNLTADVKVAFYDLLLAQRDLDLAKNNLSIVEDVRRIVGVRVRLGEAPQFELIKAEVEVLKANQAVTRAENTVRVNRVILDTLHGRRTRTGLCRLRRFSRVSGRPRSRAARRTVDARTPFYPASRPID